MQVINLPSTLCSHDDLLCRTLDVLYQKLNPTQCFVAQINTDTDHATTLCHLEYGRLSQNFSYQLSNTHCKTLLNSGKKNCYFQGVKKQYPNLLNVDDALILSYLGVLLYSKEHKVIGILVCLFQQNVADQHNVLSWMTEYSQFISSVFWQQQTASRIQQLEKRLAEIERLSNIGSWNYDVLTQQYWCSDEAHRIFGTDKAKPVTFQQVLQILHPEDQVEYQETFDALITGEIPSYDFIHRITLEDGKEKYLLEKAQSKQSDGCSSFYIEGKIQDITQLYQLSSDKKLHNFVLEHTSEAVMITNSLNRIVFVNKAMLHITGYSKAQLLGQSPSILASGKQSADFYNNMWQVLHSEDHWRGEIYNRRKDGSCYPEELSISIIRNNEGNISNYVAIFRDISQWKKREKELKYYAEQDPLTGLSNRRVFLKRLNQYLKTHTERAQLAVLFIDVDDFKLVNDVYGHEIGDLLLRTVGQRIENAVATHGLLCRYGGDEFTVLLCDTNLLATEQLVSNILQAFQTPFMLQEHKIETTVSIGIDISPASEVSAKQLLNYANYAMRNAKKKGHNDFSFHDQVLQQQYKRKLFLKEGLKQALLNDLLEVHYQPIFDTRNDRYLKFEALVRWPDNIGGFISPVEFISIAEEYGLIQDLGRFVCKTACHDLKKLHNLGYTDISFSINRSIKEFVNEDTGHQSIISSIETAGIPYHSIIIEVTESVAMSDNHYANKILSELRKKGIRIALDDFCTGYSSLNYLIDYEIDIIKIDRSFIKTIETDNKTKILTSTVLQLAEKLNLEVIAEGVEREAQLAYLKENNCHQIQGYYFSPALNISDCITLLASQTSKAVL